MQAKTTRAAQSTTQDPPDGQITPSLQKDNQPVANCRDYPKALDKVAHQTLP